MSQNILTETRAISVLPVTNFQEIDQNQLELFERARLQDQEPQLLLAQASEMPENLRGADLRNVDLTNVNLAGVDLTGANLAGVNLASRNLTGTKLALANLSGTRLAGANLTGADLSGADLTHANMRRSILHQVNLSQATLAHTQFQNSELPRASLRGAQIIQANFSNADLSQVDFSGSELLAVKFNGANLSWVSFINADMRRAQLNDANLKGAVLDGADLRRASLQRVAAHNVSWVGANLSHANLKEADLSWANFSRANLRRANLHSANAYGMTGYKIDLRGADLRAASIPKAYLPGADLSGAKVRGVDFSGTIFWSANLYTNWTRAKHLLTIDWSREKSIKGVYAQDASISLGKGGTSNDQLPFFVRDILYNGRQVPIDMAPENLNVSQQNPPRLLSDAGYAASNVNDYIRTHPILSQRLVNGSLQGADLSGLDLAGADFRNQNLTGVNLNGVNLIGADLSGANLFDARLQGAGLDLVDLSRANLDEADLTGATLQGADLSYARGRRARMVNVTVNVSTDFMGSNFSFADWGGARLTGARMQGTSLQAASFENAELNDVDLSWADLRKAKFGGASLKGTSFEYAQLQHAILSGALINNETDLSNAMLANADLSELDLTGVRLEGAMLQEAKLQRAVLNGQNLSNMNLSKANLQGAQLSGARLSESFLEQTDLRNAQLLGADLSGTNFDEAQLVGANLSGANLSPTYRIYGAFLPNGMTLRVTQPYYASFQGADLSGAILTEATLNETNFINANLTGADFTGSQVNKIFVKGASINFAALNTHPELEELVLEQGGNIVDSIGGEANREITGGDSDDSNQITDSLNSESQTSTDLTSQHKAEDQQLFSTKDNAKAAGDYSWRASEINPPEKKPGMIGVVPNVNGAVKDSKPFTELPQETGVPSQSIEYSPPVIKPPSIDITQTDPVEPKPDDYNALPDHIQSVLPESVYQASGLNAARVNARYETYNQLHPEVRGEFSVFVKLHPNTIDLLRTRSAQVDVQNAELNMHNEKALTARQLQQQLTQLQTTPTTINTPEPKTQPASMERITLSPNTPPAYIIRNNLDSTQNNIVGANLSGRQHTAGTVNPNVAEIPMISLKGKQGDMANSYTQTDSIPQYMLRNTRTGLQLQAVIEKSGGELAFITIPNIKIPAEAKATQFNTRTQHWDGLPQLSQQQLNDARAYLQAVQRSVIIPAAPATGAPVNGAPVSVPVAP